MPEPAARESKVKFLYDAYFDYKLDNREFDEGNEQFTESMTLYGARLTPSLGLQVKQNRNVKHKLMIGIDLMKEFGRHPSAVANSPECDRGLENTRLFREITMYYGLDADLGRWNIRGYAGVFPRHFAEGEYSQAFFSDSLKFYDNNLEGVLIKAYGPKLTPSLPSTGTASTAHIVASSSTPSVSESTVSMISFLPASRSNIIIMPMLPSMEV